MEPVTGASERERPSPQRVSPSPPPPPPSLPAALRSRSSVSTSRSTSSAPDPAREQKSRDILDACERRDFERLRALAETKGGFLTDELRRRAWPILLGNGGDDDSVDDALDEKADAASWKELPRHRDEDQVQLDVNRSFIYYPSDQSDVELEGRKAELSALIVEVLRRHPFLCYFQGYHDICQVLLLVLPPNLRAPLATRLSLLRIRDFMLPTLAPTVAQLRLIPDVLLSADPALRAHVAAIQPFYALGGTLTMYAHSIEGYGDIARLFDALLAREPVFTVYLYAQIVLDRREVLFDTAPDDTSMLHFILSKIPDRLDLDALVEKASALLDRFPPESLPTWRRISGSSCLKTARSVGECARQTLDDGRERFEQQARELEWAERRDRILQAMWGYRRPAQAVGLAVAVGLVAMYLRRNPGPVNYLASAVSRWVAS